MKRVLLTDRDLELFRFINSFRYVHAKHIFRKFCVSENFYRRLLMLVKNGFLIHETIFRSVAGHYRCTKKAADVAQDELPAPREIILSTYHHDMMLVDLALELERRTGGMWITERRLRSASREEGLRRFDLHYPDGLLILKQADRKLKIAVELEHLPRKSKKRIASIIESYIDGTSAVKSVDGVMYFCCTPAIQKKISEVVKYLGTNQVEVHLLSEILPERSEAHGSKTEHIQYVRS